MWKWTFLLLTSLSYGANMHTTHTITHTAPITHFTLNEQGNPIWLDQHGKLYALHQNQAQAISQETFATSPAPIAQFGRIALADREQRLTVLHNQSQAHAKETISPLAPILALPLATIAIVQEGQKFHIARFEQRGEALEMVAIRRDFEVLPDAVVKQMDLGSGEHLVVLGQPDGKTYQHGVLGDSLEAKALYYLERHSLENLAEPLVLEEGLVFEANEVQPFQKRFAVSTVAGDGKGARTVIIRQAQNKLEIMSQSEALPSHRWQSPFAFQDKLYAVRMPHLSGELVQYDFQDKQSALPLQSFGTGYSNHKIHDHQTNLTAITENFALIPHRNYQSLAVLTSNGFSQSLDFDGKKIQQLRANSQSAWALLSDNSLWSIEITK
ncbi:MAG: hypothetical protein Q4B71_00540 [Cardiobacteriaceae bacterium]|nr:hypothetical protein [Cardiobacteriaceae bacterium]